MQFGLEFLTLQVTFAKRVAAVSDVPLEHALFQYTSLPIRFGVPFGDLVEGRPEWQAFLAELRQSDDLSGTVEVFHERAQRSLLGLFPTRPQFGCFSFHYIPRKGIVRPHFAQHDTSAAGPLDVTRAPARRVELTAMLQQIRIEHPDARFILGKSWLYNLEAYRRLFPPTFIETLQPRPHEYHSLGLWGQFLNRRGQVKPDLAARFLERVAAAADLDALAASFQFSILRAACDVGVFYRHFGIAY